MQILTVGTSPTLVFNENRSRKRLTIQMQPSSVDTNNTGRVHIGAGFQPIATVGHTLQGEIIIQSGGINEPGANRELDPKYKEAIWATASAANQSLVIAEELLAAAG